jgi:NAD(P)-dependent dehydrogenase (short-subunit alcohol dehydrogenase family)
MDLKLRGKRALVTGSTAGIGFAIARGLARERAEVIINGRSEDKVAEAVRREGPERTPSSSSREASAMICTCFTNRA